MCANTRTELMKSPIALSARSLAHTTHTLSVCAKKSIAIVDSIADCCPLPRISISLLSVCVCCCFFFARALHSSENFFSIVPLLVCSNICSFVRFFRSFVDQNANYYWSRFRCALARANDVKQIKQTNGHVKYALCAGDWTKGRCNFMGKWGNSTKCGVLFAHLINHRSKPARIYWAVDFSAIWCTISNEMCPLCIKGFTNLFPFEWSSWWITDGTEYGKYCVWFFLKCRRVKERE